MAAFVRLARVAINIIMAFESAFSETLLLFTASIYTGVATCSGFRHTAWPPSQYFCLSMPPAIWSGAFFSFPVLVGLLHSTWCFDVCQNNRPMFSIFLQGASRQSRGFI